MILLAVDLHVDDSLIQSLCCVFQCCLYFSMLIVFPGAPWRTSQTISSELLLSDSRMRVESHTILGEDGKRYDDWIWMDVVDQINVIPYILQKIPSAAASSDDLDTSTVNRWKGGKFRVFRQRKYGMLDQTLATCGGQIEMAQHETPLNAAKREVCILIS